MPQPVIAGSGQPVVSSSPQSFVFLPPYLVHGVTQMLGHMEFVEHNLAIGFRYVLPHRGDVRVPQVHRYGPDTADLLGCKRFPEAIQAALPAIFRYVPYAPSDQILHPESNSCVLSETPSHRPPSRSPVRFAAVPTPAGPPAP